MFKKIGTGFIALILILGIASCGGASEGDRQPSPSASAAAVASATPRPSPSPTVAPSSSAASQSARTDAQVVEVVDGDTLKVSIDGGTTQTVRIIGVDTPETKDPRQPVMCFGAEATAKTKELVDLAGGHVQLEKDVSDTDRYDRLLRYVWLIHPDGTRMLNEELVKGGYAQVSTYPPDVKYQEQFLATQRQARESGAGLWGACGSFGVEATPVPTVASPPVNTTGGGSSYIGGSSYGGGDMDCKDFSSQAEAQAYFDARGGSASNNVDRLDGSDHDGIVCESLP